MTLVARSLLVFCALICSLIGDNLLAGEWNVGFKTIQLSDPVIDKEIEVALWYPSEAESKAETIGPAILNLAREAKPIAKAQGLIVISHGFTGSLLSHNDTAQYLAKQGYLVATPTHPDLPGLRSRKPELDPLVVRPRHIKLIVDQLLNHPPGNMSLRQKYVGIVGFSLGTYSALVAMGAEPDLSGLGNYCLVNAKDDLLCSPGSKQRFGMIAPHLESKSDKRIAAAVLLAPAYGPFFSEGSLKGIEASIQLVSAEEDLELDYQYNVQHFAKYLPNSGSIEVIKGAGHFVFIAPCPDSLKQAVPFICKDSESVDREAVHEKLNSDIARFFNNVLS